MTTMTETQRTTQVYRVYIKATPQAIWDAITTPEWTERYGYQAPAEYDLRPGGAYRGLATEEMKAYGAPDRVVDGEVSRPIRRGGSSRPGACSWTRSWWRRASRASPGRSRRSDGGVTQLTVTHDLDGRAGRAALVSGEDPNAGGGWAWVLSDLKTLLETGTALEG